MFLARKGHMPKQEKTDREKMIARIARIEGQLRGIRRMVEGESECLAVITQISAVREAVAMLGVALLKNDIACKWDGKQKISESYLKSLFRMK